MTTTAEELAGKITQLTSFPDVAFRINEALSDETSSAADIGALIEPDPALSAAMLRIANSAIYSTGGTVNSVDRAVTIVGLQEVRDLAFGICANTIFRGIPNDLISVEDFWKHSLYCAAAAQSLGRQAKVCMGESLFTAGLLHDIGHLIMFNQLPDLSREALQLSLDENDGLSPYLSERKVFGFDHMAVGAELARQWRLPDRLRECIEFHHDPFVRVKRGRIHFCHRVSIEKKCKKCIRPLFPLSLALWCRLSDHWIRPDWNMETAATQLNDKFALVQQLADDLSKGDIELPSFPDIVLRVRQALEDEHCTTKQLVQLIGAEPVLAARLLGLANSAALGPSGDPITDLNMAVNRIGRIMVRSSAMSFAMTQMQNARKLDTVKAHLSALWEQSSHVAALCYVLTRKYTKLNPDEAMFVGLMHGIGNMYILVRAEDFPSIFKNETDMIGVMDEWGSSIGGSIIENWGFADHIAAAVRDYKDTEREHENGVDYSDILILAYLFFQFVNASEDTEFVLNDVPASQQLNLAATDMLSVLTESQEQIASLRRALGK